MKFAVYDWRRVGSNVLLGRCGAPLEEVVQKVIFVGGVQYFLATHCVALQPDQVTTMALPLCRDGGDACGTLNISFIVQAADGELFLVFFKVFHFLVVCERKLEFQLPLETRPFGKDG